METSIKQLQCISCDIQNKWLCLTAFYVHEKEIMVFNGEIIDQGYSSTMPCFTSHGLQAKKDEIIDRNQRKECNRDSGGRPRKRSL